MWCVPAGFMFFLKNITFLRKQSLFHDFKRKGRGRRQQRQRQHDTETPDPVQTQISSHTGIKYLVRGIPPSDKSSNLLYVQDRTLNKSTQTKHKHKHDKHVIIIVCYNLDPNLHVWAEHWST